jgi:hypothetical protein
VDVPSAAVSVHAPADLVIALIQDRATTEVPQGENRGRTLIHSAVVRSFTFAGSIAPDALNPGAPDVERTVALSVERGWSPAAFRVVGLLQERSSRRIVGAGAVRVE